MGLNCTLSYGGIYDPMVFVGARDGCGGGFVPPLCVYVGVRKCFEDTTAPV